MQEVNLLTDYPTGYTLLARLTDKLKKGKSIIFCCKPLPHQTAMPQRLYTVLKTCQRAVDSPRNTPKIIKFANYSVYTTSSQRPYYAPTASLYHP